MIYRTLSSLEKVSTIGTYLLGAWQFSALMTITNYLSLSRALSTIGPTNFSLLTCLAFDSDIGYCHLFHEMARNLFIKK